MTVADEAAPHGVDDRPERAHRAEAEASGDADRDPGTARDRDPTGVGRRPAANGRRGTAIVAVLVTASLGVSIYHVLAHSAPLVPTLLGQGLLLVVSLLFAVLCYRILTGVESPGERDVIGVRAGAGFVVATVALVAYAVHQFLSPEATPAVDVVLFEATFVGTAGGIAGLLLGRETARHRRTIGALETTTAELERSRDRIAAERARFASLFGNAPSMIVDVRRDGDALRVADANPAFTEEVSASSVTGSHLAAILGHDDPDLAATLRDAVADGRRYEGEVTVGAEDAAHYKVRVVPYDAADDTDAAFVIYTDVTELREAKRALETRYAAADAALQRRNEQLERSTEHLNEFAYVAAHDLREPVRMVRSYVDLLATEYADAMDEEADEYVTYAVEGAERMEAMTDGLLEFSRVSMADLELTDTDVEAVVRRVQDRLADRIADADATVTVEALPDVVADADLLATLFEHLLRNALQHGGADAPPTVTVSATDRGDRVVYHVADDGPGIPAAEQPQVFEVFEQRDRDAAGEGIGLAVCQRIVDRHGGDLRVESTPGEGATFHVTLPTRDADRPDRAVIGADVDRL